MNTKELIASELASVIDSLDQEAILNLLETRDFDSCEVKNSS